MAFSVAIQVYSVRDDAKADLRGTLEQIKKMGYDGVEFAGLYGYAPADIKAMCAEIGLTPISAHVPYLDMLADPKGVLSQYAEICVKFVAVPYLTPEYRPGTEKFPEVVKNVEMIGKVAIASPLMRYIPSCSSRYGNCNDSIHCPTVSSESRLCSAIFSGEAYAFSF